MNKLLKILIPVFVILGLILAAGCATKQTSVTAPPFEGGAVPAPPAPQEMLKSNTYDTASHSVAGEVSTTDMDRKIVKNGNMTLEVNDITAALTGVAAIATDLNGYVVSSNKSGDKDATYGQSSIRVPSDRFDQAFDELRKLAVNVPNESTNSQDVTEQYTDLQAQLRNLEATEAQYLELLKKAEKVEDILAVQRELSNVRGQIEQVKGRILYIERTSDMALIDVNLQKVKPIGGTAWSVLETLKSAARGLVSFGKVLAIILIWVAVFSPVWIIILLVVLYFTRWRHAKARTSRK
ncbi:MAG: DUF4349 domain-containing protein [Dehalococcoidia bacterium]